MTRMLSIIALIVLFGGTSAVGQQPGGFPGGGAGRPQLGPGPLPPMAGMTEAPQGGLAAIQAARMPSPRRAAPPLPRNLNLYRTTMPNGVDPEKLSPLSDTTVRELPYLHRSNAHRQFIVPPGMELPEQLRPERKRKPTLGERINNILFPFGNPLGILVPGR